MIKRDLDRLRELEDRARAIGRRLETPPFQHERISLPIGEALKAVSRLEGWIADAVCIAEAELYHGPGK